MDRNTIIGFVLMFGLLMGYNWYTAPTEEEIAEMERVAAEEAKQQENSSEKTTSWNDNSEESTEELKLSNLRSEKTQQYDTLGTVVISPELSRRYGPFAEAVPGNDNTYTLQTSVLKLILSDRGAMFQAAFLTDGNKRYSDGQPVELWDPSKSSINLQFDVQGTGRIKTSDLHFTVNTVSDSSIEFQATVGPGRFITINHSLVGYQVESNITFVGLQGLVSQEQYLDWSATGLRNEKGLVWERQHTSIFYKEKGRGRSYLSEGRSDEESIEYDLEWMAFKQDFFSTIVSREGGFKIGANLSNELFEDDTTSTLLFSASLPMDAKVTGNRMGHHLSFYLGPNDINQLTNTGFEEADRIIDYGWWIFGWVNRNFILPLYSFLSSHIASAGLIILIITLIIKMFLFPITWKNFLSSAKMKMLRPDIEKINEEHKDDSTARQQATMELYRKTGVNPMAGCLPALLQMPVLYAMFRFFPANIDLRGEGFLWADDLAAYDSIIDLPFTVPFYGDHISGFTVLMAVSIFFYMRMTTAGQPPQPQQPGMPNMKVIQNFIPFTMLFFFNKFASGLSLYYLVANLVSIGQMLIIKRYFIDEDKIRAKIDANVKNPKKKSAFQERLAEMQKEQKTRTKDIKSKRSKSKK